MEWVSYSMSWKLIDIEKDEEIIKTEILDTFIVDGVNCTSVFHKPKELVERKAKVGRIVEYWKRDDGKFRFILGFLNNPDLDKIKFIYITTRILDFSIFKQEDVDKYVSIFANFIKNYMIDNNKNIYFTVSTNRTKAQFKQFAQRFSKMAEELGIKTTKQIFDDYEYVEYEVIKDVEQKT